MRRCTFLNQTQLQFGTDLLFPCQVRISFNYQAKLDHSNVYGKYQTRVIHQVTITILNTLFSGNTKTLLILETKYILIVHKWLIRYNPWCSDRAESSHLLMNLELPSLLTVPEIECFYNHNDQSNFLKNSPQCMN
jgi:hypothetical protein